MAAQAKHEMSEGDQFRPVMVILSQWVLGSLSVCHMQPWRVHGSVVQCPSGHLYLTEYDCVAMCCIVVCHTGLPTRNGCDVVFCGEV